MSEELKDIETNDEKSPTMGDTVAENAENGDDATESVVDGDDVEELSEPSLREVISKQAIEGEAHGARHFTLGKILGGEILTTNAVKKQIWLVLIIAVFLFAYISNRYSCQQKMIEIDKLQKELVDAKYKALSSTSRLTEISRESNVLEALKNNNDSTIKTPTQPPYIITVPTNE